MGALEARINSIPQTRIELGVGEEAVRATIILMDRIIKEGAKDYYVRAWAEQILRKACITRCDDYTKISIIFDFIHTHTLYLWDIDGTELIKTPKTTLKEIEAGYTPYLDCDCLTVLLLALLRSIGYRVAIRAIALQAIALQKNGVFSHVYGMVHINQKWCALDLTKPENGAGWEPYGATRIITRIVK